ncbi:MAG: type II toxin-antitoxin system RelE/ParE family toxin [Methylobacteriaceae bacterium]|nr:type II toxin-antitoxin system RelE/ParE family toxin [Methylobacteriaceae bacterium]
MGIRYRPRAERDLIDIADYLLARNPPAARSVRDAILHTIDLVADFPELGVRVDEGVRRIVVGRYGYRIYYEVDEAKREIVVTTIRHSRRQPL